MAIGQRYMTHGNLMWFSVGATPSSGAKTNPKTAVEPNGTDMRNRKLSNIEMSIRIDQAINCDINNNNEIHEWRRNTMKNKQNAERNQNQWIFVYYGRRCSFDLHIRLGRI